MPNPQAINAAQTRAALFLILAVKEGPEHADRVRDIAPALAGLVRAVAARDPEANLSCVLAFGSDVWGRLFDENRPQDLHPFREISSGGRYAPSTPGDLLFHIRAERMDLCFELGQQIANRLAASAVTLDEIHGFRYFDDRDLIGFVDGTENPTGEESLAATIVGDQADGPSAGGSCVIVQKYMHDLPKWNSQPVEAQEKIVGRTKLDDIELDESVKPAYAHNVLTSIEQNGEEIKILRHNMPFGNVSGDGSGTFFIGYASSPQPIEQMLENMFVGNPPGNYDRLLDYTHPVSGINFFAPSLEFLAQPPSASHPAVDLAIPQ
jgi:porphyrinogen peroxidase